MKVILTPRAPFDFLQMLRRPMSRPSSLILIDANSGTYTRAVRLRSRVCPVTVRSVGSVDGPELCLEYPDDLAEDERDELLQRMTQMFSLERNLQDFYETVSVSKEWAGLIQRLYGVRPIQDADLFESMVRTIIGQQLNLSFAATLMERLVQLGDERVVWKQQTLPVFPSAKTVAEWTYPRLRELAFSQRKAEYVIDFARHVASGAIDLEKLRDLPDEDVYEVLMPLRGVGRWTVECFLLFGMGRTDILPAADIGIQNAVQRLYHMADRPKEADIRQIASVWAPWRSYATYYLWQSLLRDEN
jgi:DNA-3-methyladenine glycosylase II